MSEQWFYRDFQREVGPLDFQALHELALTGVIGSEDVVRNSTARVWVKARSIPELFAQPANELDLDSMLASADSAAQRSQASRGRNADECYCLVGGRELGPMPFEELGGLARNGELTPRHKVRMGGSWDWIEAGAIVGLFESETLPSAGTPHRETSQDEVNFELRPPVKAPAGVSRTSSAAGSEVEWHWRVLGQETGPFTFDAIFELAQSGRMTASDEVRCGSRGDWVLASAISGLVPESQKSIPPADEQEQEDDGDCGEQDEDSDFDDLVADIVQESNRNARRPRTKKSTGRRDPAHTSRPKRKEPSAARKVTTARSSAAEVELESPHPAPPPRAAAAIERPTPRPPAPAPYPAIMSTPAPKFVMPPRKSRSPSGGSKVDPKVAGGVAAVVLIGLALWKFGLPSFGGGGMSAETIAIWQEAVLLHQPEYEGAPWEQFKQRTLPKLQELAARLEQSGTSDPRAQVMLRCSKEYLPAILEAGADKTTKEWQAMADSIKQLTS